MEGGAMNWQALWADGPVTRIHALVAILAMAVGAIQLAAPKGTWRHRRLGFVWVGAMAVVASRVSGFTNSAGGDRSRSSMRCRCWFLRRSSIRSPRSGAAIVAHRRSMVQLYVLALLVTGLFTLVPGRAMHAVLFGG
jgi:uncharacterized membrane protein